MRRVAERLAETDFVSQQDTARERRPEREERRVDLVRIQIDLRVHQGAGQSVVTVGGAATRQLVRVVLGVIGRQRLREGGCRHGGGQPSLTWRSTSASVERISSNGVGSDRYMSRIAW